MKSSCNLGINLGKDLGRPSKFALLLSLIGMWVQVKNVRYPYDATSWMNTRWGHLTHRFVVKICGWALGIAQAYISDICWWPLISVSHARAWYEIPWSTFLRGRSYQAIILHPRKPNAVSGEHDCIVYFTYILHHFSRQKEVTKI